MGPDADRHGLRCLTGTGRQQQAQPRAGQQEPQPVAGAPIGGQTLALERIEAALQGRHAIGSQGVAAIEQQQQRLRLSARQGCSQPGAGILSHSGDLILLALHRQHAVGVDVERHRPGLDWQPLADRWLPSPERHALEALPPGQRLAGFLQAWCRLEARLKARGCGLAGVEQLRRPQADGQAVAGERLLDLQLPEGHHGAVAWLEAGPPR